MPKIGAGANLDDVDNLYDEDEEMHNTQDEKQAKKQSDQILR